MGVGATGVGAEGGETGAGFAGAGDEADDGAGTAALGFGTEGFVPGLIACGGSTAPLAAGAGRKSRRFAAKTLNASTPIKKMSASTWFLEFIALSECCALREGDAIACLAP